MDNIPQFEALKGLKDTYNTAKNASIAAEKEVTTATEAYQTAAANTVAAKAAYENDPNHAVTIQAKKEYDDAVTWSNSAENEYNTALKKIETLTSELEGLKADATSKEQGYNKAESDVENFSGKKTESTPHTTTTTENVPIPYYTDLYNAISDEYDYNNGTSNGKKLTYGVIKGASFSIIVFAPHDINVQTLLTTNEKKNYTPYNKELTVYSINEWGDYEGVNFDGDLSEFVVSGVSKLRVRFYYKDDENNEQSQTTTTVSGVDNPIQALIVGYESLRIGITKTETTYTDEDTEEYAKVKAARDNALDDWNKAKAKVSAKELELSEAETAADKALSKLGTMSTLVQNKYNAWQTALDNEKPVREKWEAAQKAEEDALAAVTAAEKKKETADNAVETAKTNYNNAAELLLGDDEIKYDDNGLIICEAYTTIDITADFIDGVSTITEWPAGYTLNGNGHIIETTGALFKTNKGEINGLATPNGHIANDNKEGTVTLSLTKWDEQYRVYKASGEYTNYDTAEDAIYSMRNTASFKFGYDIKSGAVKTLSDATKLYQAKYANARNKNGYTFRFNLNNDNLVYDETTFNDNIKGGYTLENAMLYIENNDVTNAVKNETNVAVKSGNVYVCKNAQLKEGADIKEFYISENVKATNLSYGRDFKQKVVAVCLPFELTADYIKTQNIEVFQFNKVDGDGVMWFTEKGSIAANKPCLIRFSGEKGDGPIFAELSEQLLEKTPAELVENIGEYKFCGTYASAYPSELIGNTQGVLYGVQNGGLVKTDANSTSRLHQFRSYVWQPNAVSANAAPSYKIGLMDEDGNELSTAIETVSGEIISGFKAKGGDNAIEITTDKACPVKVYALNGALVKSTRVEAGSTSLPVKAGMYVVNGTKVIVK